MKKKKMATILTLALAASMVFGSTAFASEEKDESSSDETYTLIVSTTRTGWIADWYDEYFEDLEEKSGGRLQFQVNHNNEIGNPADCVTMFEQGLIDILDMNVSASGANMPVSDLVHVPYYCDDPKTAADIMWELYDEGFMTEYDGMHVLMYIPTDMMMVASTKKLETLEDFKGLKVRASSPMILNALELCGATAVSIQADEVYMALSQGTIDAAVSSPLFMVLQDYPDVCDYLLYMPICTGMCYMAVNEDTWDSLPADLQELIEEETDVYYDKYIDELYASTDEYKQELADAGMDVYEPSEELESQIIELTSEVLTDYEQTLLDQGYDVDAILEISDAIIEDSNNADESE